MPIDTFEFAGGSGFAWVFSRERTPDEKRHDWLVTFHRSKGWLNCAHKSLERLEAEYVPWHNAESSTICADDIALTLFL